MRIASQSTLRRAQRLRATGKTWLELTRNEGSRRAGLAFFTGARDDGAEDGTKRAG